MKTNGLRVRGRIIPAVKKGAKPILPRPKSRYFTDKERLMTEKMLILQGIMGIESCKTKGDVSSIIMEIVDILHERRSKRLRAKIRELEHDKEQLGYEIKEANE